MGADFSFGATASENEFPLETSSSMFFVWQNKLKHTVNAKIIKNAFFIPKYCFGFQSQKRRRILCSPFGYDKRSVELYATFLSRRS